MPERDNERARAEAMDRLLARTLRQTQGAGGPDCPEPDILAAYCERSLTDAEAQRWERHFSACSRCQQTLSALAMSQTETPQAAQEHVSAAHPATSEPWTSRRIPWHMGRWLVPAAAIAAVVLWIVGKPAAPWKQSPTLTAQKTPSGTPVSGLPAEPKNSEERAKSVSPTRRETHSYGTPGEEGRGEKPGPDLGAKREPPRFDRSRSSLGPRKEPPPSESDHLRREELSRSGAPAAVNPSAGAGGVASGQQRDEFAPRDKSIRAGGQFKEKSPELSAEARPQEQEKQTPQRQPTKDVDPSAKPKAPAQTTAPSPEVADQANAAALGNRSNLAEKKGSTQARPAGGLAATTLRGALETSRVIWAPTGSVRWRIGAAGRIERSTDRGTSWQLQTSGVTLDLSDGSAPSESVCWVVGRAGTILRTTDGEHWEKIAPPAMLDWTLVRAQDALHAGISARDDGHFRHFVTEDGGRTWQEILQR